MLSSRIEGTQSSLSDLLLYEANESPGVPLDDVAEVSSYVAAMEHGLRRIRDGFPLSRCLVRELTGRRRNRIFSYVPYIRILSEGTEPL